MKFKKLFIIVFLSIFLLPTLTFALNFEVNEEVISSEMINDDYYVAGGSVQIDSDINGDLVVGGGRLMINSIISQDLTLAGGEVTVNGEVQDDARLAGGNITISAIIKDDLILGGGNVILTDTGFVGGDFIFGGGNVIINGMVNGDVMGAGGNVTINNVIKGDVVLYNVDSIAFGQNGRVMGNLSYRSPNPSKTATKQHIRGLIEYEPSKVSVSDKKIQLLTSGILAGFSIFRLLAILLSGLILIWLVRFFMTNSVKAGYTEPFKSLGFGFLALILPPIVALILLITGIGYFLSFLLVLMWLFLIFLGKLTGILMIGMLIVSVKSKSGFWRVYGAFALGALIYILVSLVPIIGWIAQFILILIGMGAVVLHETVVFHLVRSKKLV